MIVRELFAKVGLSLDAGSFVKAELAVEGIKKGLEFLKEKLEGAAEGFVEIFKGTAEFSKEIEEMSARTGISTDSLQELRYAAKLSGVDLGELANGVKFLGVNMSKAADGSTEALDAFRKLGVDVKDKTTGKLKGMDEMLGDVADGFTRIEDPARRSQLAVEIFGKSGTALIPFLRKGKVGIEEMREEAHALGLVLTEEEVAAGAEFQNGLMKMSFAAEGLRNQIAGPLMEGLKELTHEMVEWVKQNKEWLRTKIHQAVELLKTGLVMLAATVRVVAKVVFWMADAVSWVVDKFWLLVFSMGATLLLLLLTIPALMTTVGWYVALSVQAIATGLAMAWAWLVAAAPALMIIAILGILFVVLEDLWSSITTGNGVFADFWAAILDSDTVWALKKFFKAIPEWASGAVTKVKEFFVGLWEFIKWGFRATISAIPGGAWALNKMGAGTGQGSTAPTPTPSSPLVPGPLFGGGATSPGATATVGGYGIGGDSKSLNYSPIVNAPITINASPGTAAEAIAAATVGHLEDANTRQLREAHAAVGR